MRIIKEKQSAEELIKTLSEGLTKTKVMAHPIRRALPWLLLSVIYMAIAVFALGLRADIGMKITQMGFVFELLYVFIIAITAGLASSWLCVPDIRGNKLAVAIPLVLFVGAVAWLVFSSNIPIYKAGVKFHHCYIDSIVLTTIPSFAILFFSIKGRTTHPYIMSFMNILSIGALGYIGLRLVCLADGSQHLCYIHILPYLLLGIIMAVLGRRIYRW